MKTNSAPWDYRKRVYLTADQIAAANAQIDRNKAICNLLRGTVLEDYVHPQYKKIMREYNRLVSEYNITHPDCTGLADHEFALARVQEKWSR